jgi:hypothetical protein
VGRRAGNALPDDPQAEPTIGKAIKGNFDLLEAKCNRGMRLRLADRFAFVWMDDRIWEGSAVVSGRFAAGESYKVRLGETAAARQRNVTQ